MRTSNPRDASSPRVRTPSESLRRDGGSSTGSGDLGSFGPSRESVRKLDQIVQNYFVKAGTLVLGSRIKTTQAEGSRSNKWFSIETDEFEEFQSQLRIWRTSSSLGRPFPPMIIETYLDASRLPPGQCLVVVDDNERKTDVLEALNSPRGSPTFRTRVTEVLLERWRFELNPSSIEELEEFGHTLPTIYKKAVPLFRSLHALARLIPAHRVFKQSVKERRSSALEVKCRILTGETEDTSIDTLRQPISGAQDVVGSYRFADLEVPTGRLSAVVTYRTDGHFKLVDSESLLSSRFTSMEIDENFFKPSLPQRVAQSRRETSAEVGSLPSRRRGKESASEDATQAYGSMSTFHGAGAMGTSPISALRALRPMGSEASSPRGSTPASMQEPANSLLIRSSMRGQEGLARRSSVSFQPFKAGSLSGSPRIPEGSVSASPMSGQRLSGLSALPQARKRNSLTAGMPASLRGGPPPGELPVSSSPRPSGSRVSSSFSHRRARSSLGGQSRGDDDQMSSGRQSLSSSIVQPSSGILAEGGGQSNSGSLTADDDDIGEFIKALESRKTLRSFDQPGKGESATKRTVAQLSKFQQMRDSNNALTESMASSMQLHRSSSTSSRQLASVPGMMAPASMSVSSSPGGKPLSPHTPHTPLVPSRLSENSIIDYESQASAARRAARVAPQVSPTEEEQESGPAVNAEGTMAIDIPLPLSPRLTQTNRRSSSVAQQQRNLVEEDDNDGFDSRRSISLGAEREPPTLSTLFSMEAGGSCEDSAGLQPAAHIRSLGLAGSPSPADRERATSGDLLTGNNADTPGRLRYTSRRGRPTPPQSSRGSFASSSRGGYGMGRGDNDADDEPLLFDMQVSEMGRRSLEEGRGGGGVGSNSAGVDRNLEEKPRGITRRGWS
ncbi:unnamed protein product [Discula destructiva]